MERYSKALWNTKPELRKEYEENNGLWDLKYKLVSTRVKNNVPYDVIAKAMDKDVNGVKGFEAPRSQSRDLYKFLKYAKAVGLKEIRIKL